MLYTQEEFLSRLQRYRQLGASYDSVVDYFDELEIHPEYFGTVFKVTDERRSQCSFRHRRGTLLCFNLSGAK